MEQLERPKCPNCKRNMSPAGGIVGINVTTDWACWTCDERIVDTTYETIDPEPNGLIQEIKQQTEDGTIKHVNLDIYSGKRFYPNND